MLFNLHVIKGPEGVDISSNKVNKEGDKVNKPYLNKVTNEQYVTYQPDKINIRRGHTNLNKELCPSKPLATSIFMIHIEGIKLQSKMRSQIHIDMKHLTTTHNLTTHILLS